MNDSTITDLARRCADLRARHRPGHPLVLPNAWDAASARAVAEAGYPAIATSSGAVAAALGFADHEAAPIEEMLAAAGRIVAAVDVPVTVDAEAGYGLEPADLVGRLVAIGAAGANVEDTDHRAGTLRPLDEQADRLRSLRAAADAVGVPFVLNARVDVFVAGRGQGASSVVGDAVTRANAYLAAGADCVYPIFLADPPARDAFIAAVDGPVNVLTWPGGRRLRNWPPPVPHGSATARRCTWRRWPPFASSSP
jgi:2-methylisocitrate lyase-like PEP mutase family enzyme